MFGAGKLLASCIYSCIFCNNQTLFRFLTSIFAFTMSTVARPILTCPEHLVPSSGVPISDAEARLLPHLRELLPGLLSKDPQTRARELVFCNDACLVRYIRSVKHISVDAAAKRLLFTLQWRREFRPDLISPDEVEPEAVTGKLYMNGFDVKGRPVLYMIPGRENTTTYDRQIRYLVYNLELLITSMPPTVGKVCLLIDYTNFKNNQPFSISKRVLDILQNHYPERLGIAFMYTAPFSLSIFWRIISPFLDPVTKEKVQFPKGKEDPNFVANFPKEGLERRYGGSNPFDYDHAVYWKDSSAKVKEARTLLDLEIERTLKTIEAGTPLSPVGLYPS